MNRVQQIRKYLKNNFLRISASFSIPLIDTNNKNITMKKLIFFFLSILLPIAQVAAQGADLAKRAGKALTSYNIDPPKNRANLDEAKVLINEALQYPDAQGLASAWITKGDIYNTFLQSDMARRQLDARFQITGDNDALEAYTSYKKGYDLAQKQYEKRDAIIGASEVQGHLINIGVSKYEAGEYEKAFFSFQAALECHDLLSSNTQKSILDDPEQYNNQVYITAKSAQLAQRYDDALRYYGKLYQSGTDKAAVYEAMYTIKSQTGDDAGAGRILAEGRRKFPEDSGLLFAQINDYLKKGKTQELIGMLQQAIHQEPDNVALYVTLGNVYDNLYQQAMQAGDAGQADTYANEARQNYQIALEKDPGNIDAAYALGSQYFNKAALLTQEYNSLPEDGSEEGTQRRESLMNEMMSLFDQALPYFQKAESRNANDVNTLIALTEIYTRKGDTGKATEFKKRLDRVNAGGQNKTSFFRN